MNKTVLHGDFSLYQVFFKKLDGNESAWDNFGTRNLSLKIVDLQPVTWYGIRVLAAIDSGNGVASSLIKVKTLEGGLY